jgi:integrase
MTLLRLKYVHEFIDRHGKVRRYARLPGRKRVPLPGLPGSDEFMEAYREAVRAPLPAESKIGATQTRPGTFNALIVAFYCSTEFLGWAQETRRTRRNIIERFRAEHGDKRVTHLRRGDVDKMVAARASTPAAARNFLKTLRALMQFAIAMDMRTDDPTNGAKMPKIRTDGFLSWDEKHIEAYRAQHPIGTRARLALELLLNTGQRRGDVIRFGRQHLREGALRLRQQKTGTALEIPIHAELRAALDAMPGDHLTFLVTTGGKPFSAAGFGNLFREWCDQAGLPRGYSAHGLRKAACRRLAECGCSASQIMAISGHRSLSEAEKYVRAAEQARLARQAMATVTAAFPIKAGT